MRTKWISWISTGACLLAAYAADAQKPDAKILQPNETPTTRYYPAQGKSTRTTIFLLPDGLYQHPDSAATMNTVVIFTRAGFDVMIPGEYKNTRLAHDPAIIALLRAFYFPKQSTMHRDSSGRRKIIAGWGTGAHLAAEIVRRLTATQQPAQLILVDPAQMDETLPGTVLPAVRPPLNPEGRLALFIRQKDSAVMQAAIGYAKTWRGYDGRMTIFRSAASGSRDRYKDILDFIRRPETKKPAGDNPAARPVAGEARGRHRAKCDSLASHSYDLLMIGNSITNNFEKPEYQAVWQQFYGSRNAINLGYSGYRTENILWNLDNGELKGQQPKVAVIEIGTNNVDEKHYPTRHTSGQLAGGILAIIKTIRDRSPDTKIIVLRCFPGSYDGAKPTSHRAILDKASGIISKVADNRHVFFCDVNHVFLNLDGSINHDLMPDYLHPSPAGAKLWAQGMEPLLAELMGDSSRDGDLQANTAVIPVSKLEEDGYNWWDRHREVLAIKDSLDPEVVLIGNSITHFWGGVPVLRDLQGKPRKANGPLSYAEVFGKYRVMNLGFGWDRTQNVLWRLDHGELDGLNPRIVVVDIGTNNTSETSAARMNTAPEIVAGIDAVIRRVRSKVPGAHIVIMAIFPREKDAQHPRRRLINEINKELKVYAEQNALTLVDIGPEMLLPDQTIKPGLLPDYCHPGEKGYEIWGRHLSGMLSEP